MSTVRLPAEWEAQSGVLIAWPHADSDWAEVLEAAEACFADIIYQISRFEKVLVVVTEINPVKAVLKAKGANLKNIKFCVLETNDTWARDFGPITIMENNYPKLLDFTFNAWGMKFAADLDNLINRSLAARHVFGETPMLTLNFVLEGGSIESDGQGTILTTMKCLFSPNRNPQYSPKKLEKKIKKFFGAERILWLNSGWLAGDDTDSHIDTLARLCPNDTIVYVSCSNRKDEHYIELRKMESELKLFKTASGNPYRLLPMPMPRAHYDSDGTRLPATYANFLVINQAVLMPTYDDPENDRVARSVLASAFPDREVIGVDCRTLIIQHGSLHCVTMQVPAGVLK